MATLPNLSVIEPGATPPQRLPFNIEAEKALLGALLTDSACMAVVFDRNSVARVFRFDSMTGIPRISAYSSVLKSPST
jgi:hypothetical protein